VRFVRSVLFTGALPFLLLLVPFFHASPPPAPEDPPRSEKTFADVVSFDGHEVPVTVYRPTGADAGHPVPVILHSHGWAGSREKRDGAFPAYTAAGFGVVSIDMRGHGDARTTSEARVDHVGYEIRDVGAVIDFVSGLPWARLDRPGDPRLGAIGGSYGGGYQLLTAAFDDRLDAIVPEITWNDLPQALVPNGAPKTAWVDLLYLGGLLNTRMHPDVHDGFAYLQAANRFPDGSVPGTPDLQGQFTQSSPKSYPGRIDIPTLLIQGMPDALFNFNQAAANYALVHATGARVSLVTHLRGHILNTQGTIPVPAPTPLGLQPAEGTSPCGSYDELAIAWFGRHLLHRGGDPRPEVCLALDDGTTVTGNAYPLPKTEMRALDFAAGQTLAQGPPGPNVTFTAFTADRETIVAGIPRLTGSLQSAGPDAIVYWKLVIQDAHGGQRVADSQVTPLRVEGAPLATTSFAIDLGGVAVRLHAGDTLQLVASNADPQFAHNAERVPGAVVLGNVHLDVPIVRAGPS
jgi:ABC-2 type transport system ATP-binding protein